MDDLQLIKSSQKSKYDEIIVYLKQDDEYWLENDKWDLTKEFFMNKNVGGRKFINFSNLKSEQIRNEVKFYFLYNFKEKLLTNLQLSNRARLIQHFSKFLKSEKSVIDFNKEKILNKWRIYLIDEGINCIKNNQNYFGFIGWIIDFISSFYDDREEIEKDIWYSKNIKGAKIPASGANNTINNQLNFKDIPVYYRKTVKDYFKTIITKKSWNHCHQILQYLRYFFNRFYFQGYTDGFIGNLSRKDIEHYLY